jgi:hypothetical protein
MKNMPFAWILAAMLATGGVAGCKKSASRPSTASPPTWTPGADIYFVGEDSAQAVYWKNGVKTILGPGAAQGIAIDGSDVYVGGTVVNGAGSGPYNLPAYWKDGVAQPLADADSGGSAGQPVIAGGDVYLPGCIGTGSMTGAVYWKNGQRVDLDSGARGTAWGMAVSGSDVYVIGMLYGAVNADTNLVWKNGQRLSSTYVIGAMPYSQIFVSGGYVYLLGYYGYQINFGVLNPLSGGTGVANSMYLDGSTKYLAGMWSSAAGVRAVYWKNEEMDTLSIYPGTTFSTANNIMVAGSDVYIAGRDEANANLAVYWKNGVEETLTKQGYVSGGVVAGN